MNKCLILLVFLGACATKPAPRPEPQIIVQEVKIPVAMPCVPNTLGAAPDYVDTKELLLAQPDAAGRLQLLYGGREQRIARLSELETVVAGCPKG